MPKRLSSIPSEVPAADLDISELGRLVRQRRTEQDLSIRQAAADARVSFSTLSRVEAGAQPDLATFTNLCAWLGVDPSRFFRPTSRRALSSLDKVTEHLMTDPSLSSDAAEKIVSVIRDLYAALADQSKMRAVEPMALHLRASSVMRPGVPERLAALLTEMRTRLEEESR